MDRSRFRPEAAAPARSVPSSERWLRSHADAAAILIVALGLATRLLAARRSFVIFDETLHFQLASPASVLGVYRASLTSAHPPLFVLLLHFWYGIVGSGWQLCLLPVAFGTAFLWAAYRWAGSVFGKAPALLMLGLLAFLPSLVLLSAELRGYAMMLWLIAAALAALERAFRKGSPRWFALFAALAALALLTHYAALRFTVAVFAYAAVRLRVERSPARLVGAYAASLAAVATVFLFLHARHVSALRGGPLEREAQADWLRASYFRTGEESAIRFLMRQTAALFQFLFSSPAAGIAAGLLVLGGVALLALRRQPSAILLGLPFAIAAAGGLLRLYPYGGSRHSVDLGLFACGAIGVALSRLASDRLWVAVALAAALMPAGFAVGW
jgi:hypothetical protein